MQNKKKLKLSILLPVIFIITFSSSVLANKCIMPVNKGTPFYSLQEIWMLKNVKTVEKTMEKFGENQRKILGLISENPNISIPLIADRLNLTTRAIEKNIAKLKKESWLKMVGPAKGGYWKVTK